MTVADPLVRYASLELRPDPARVIARPFLPGQEAVSHGISRAESVIARVLALTEAEVAAELSAVVTSFAGRHPDLLAVFDRHFALVAHRISRRDDITPERVHLVGAYFTQEFAVEGAAIFNPSIVPDPASNDSPPGVIPFVLSLRAVGEGHISTIEFRTGRFGPGDCVTVDAAATRLGTGTATPAPMSIAALRAGLGEQGDARAAESLLDALPAEFTPADLDRALDRNERDTPGRSGDPGLIHRIRRLAASNYDLTFPPDLELSARVLHPTSPAEDRGLEDARFTRFDDDDGSVTHYATYTAFDGWSIASHLIRTEDFLTFSMRQMTGTAATNKGMALFPRRVDGSFWALCRWDRENLSVTRSHDAQHWQEPVIVQRPEHAWDLVQLGTCGSPIETPDGWLVITHGVGPARTYSLGAMLLDLDDPATVLAVLAEPLMTARPSERDGYVPNVVYSCGALVRDDTVLLPYGCSDATIRFALIDLPGLLRRLQARAVAQPQDGTASQVVG
jgi:predicted GH43/DUF377 family glycosyl hydrolase